VIFDLAVAPSLADEPGLFAWKVDVVPSVLAVGNADTNGRKLCGERAFGASSPRDTAKRLRAERLHGFADGLARRSSASPSAKLQR